VWPKIFVERSNLIGFMSLSCGGWLGMAATNRYLVNSSVAGLSFVAPVTV